MAEEFGPPFAAKNDAVAVRGFRQGIKDARPDEFRLYRIGSFDQTTGVVQGIEGHLVEVSTQERTVRDGDV